MLTSEEAEYFEAIFDRVQQMREFLSEHQTPQLENSRGWYSFLATLKAIQGNLNNDISFVATVMAKEFLYQRFDIYSFDAAKKPQGAPGLDIDVRTKGGLRIIGEIKTTYPYKSDDLGAQQKETFKRDFEKLNSADADEKFFFVTEQRTFDLMQKARYRSQVPGVRIVLLATGEGIVA